MVSIVTYTGDGSTTDYTIPFEYLDDAHVVVELAETPTTEWSFLNDTTVRMDTAPATDVRLVIKRSTPDAPIVDFTDGSTLFEADLDLSAKQSRLLGSEARDRADEALNLVNNNLTDILAVRSISAQVTAVSANNDNITAVADNAANINTVSANTADIDTVSGSIANVNTLAGINGDVTTLAGISADVETLADISTDIDSVADFTTELETIADDLNAGSFTAGTEYDFGSITEEAEGSTGSPDGFIVTVYNNLADIQTVSESVEDVNTLAPISANITTVATDVSNVNTVAGNISNVNTVAGVSTDVSTLAAISTDVTAVAADAADIQVVSGIATDIESVGAITANVTTVAGNTTNVNTVAGVSADVTTVAGISANVTTVAGMTSDITTVLADATDIGTVAGDSTHIQALGPVSADITTVAGISTDVTTVAGISADTSTVAGISADVTAVATNNGNVTTVAGISADVTTVAADSADIQTVAENINSINDFHDVYRVGASNPTADNDIGDLFYNTASNTLMVYNGAGWEGGVTAGSGFMSQTGGTFTGSVSFVAGQTFDGRDVSVDGAKLDGIEAGATADQTAAEIKTAYESNADTNAFTDAEQTKLAGLEANADVTDAENVEPLIDAHLNYSTATSGQFLKYNGTDYEWGTVDLTPYLALSGGTMTGTLEVPTVDFGDWTITESGGVLYFANGGTNKMKLDASGNLTVTGNVTAYGTV
jgi:hypothetical protein